MANPKKIPDRDDRLLGAYRDLIREQRFARHRSGDGEDIGQDAVLRALAIENPASVRTPTRYLLRIVRNLFVDRQRRRRREAAIHALVALAESDVSDQLNPERIVSAKQELQRVTAAISLLPPRCREAFVLHRFERLSYSAIARRMGIRSGTVEKHIAEAMLRIARAVNQVGEDNP